MAPNSTLWINSPWTISRPSTSSCASAASPKCLFRHRRNRSRPNRAYTARNAVSSNYLSGAARVPTTLPPRPLFRCGFCCLLSEEFRLAFLALLALFLGESALDAFHFVILLALLHARDAR